MDPGTPTTFRLLLQGKPERRFEVEATLPYAAWRWLMVALLVLLGWNAVVGTVDALAMPGGQVPPVTTPDDRGDEMGRGVGQGTSQGQGPGIGRGNGEDPSTTLTTLTTLTTTTTTGPSSTTTTTGPSSTTTTTGFEWPPDLSPTTTLPCICLPPQT